MKKKAPVPTLALALLAAFLGSAGCAKKPAPADLVLLNGDVYTVNPAQPTARAIVINGNYPILTSNLTIQVGGFNASVGPVTNRSPKAEKKP